MNSQSVMRVRLISSLLAAAAFVSTLSVLVFPFYSGHPSPLAENMQDTGAVLTMTRELLHGRVLYQQIYTPYGPVPHVIYEAMAWIFGNTPVTYAGFTTILSVIVLALAYILVRRFLDMPYALLFFILVTLHFSKFEIVYAACEAIGILLLAIFWVAPEERTAVRCALYGVILCFIHFSKFGSDVVAAGAFALIDLIYLVRSPDKREVLLAVLKSGVVIAASFFALFTVAAGLMICRLSPEVSRDTLWPLYMSGSYDRFKGDERYPKYLGILLFTKIHLPMLVGLSACIASVAALVVEPRFGLERNRSTGHGKDVFPYPMLLPTLFFLLACLLLFRHAWHYDQYGIYAALGAAVALNSFGPTIKRLTVLMFVPYLFVASWASLEVPLGFRPPPMLACLTTPARFSLEGPPDLVVFYQKLFRSIDEQIALSGNTTGILVLSDRPGIYFFSGKGLEGRITWYLPSYSRPWEQTSEEEAILRAGAIVLGLQADAKTENRPEPGAINRSLRVIFSPALTDFLSSRLTHPTFIGVDPSQPKVAVWTFGVDGGGGRSQHP